MINSGVIEFSRGIKLTISPEEAKDNRRFPEAGRVVVGISRAIQG